MAPGDPSAVRVSGLHHRRLALVVLLAGAVLAALALPQFLAALARAGGDSAVAALAEGRSPEGRQLERGLRSRSLALRWWPGHQDYDDLALLQMVQARALDPQAQAGQRHLLLDRAVAAARQGLAWNAADPFLWMRLAEAGFLRDGLEPGLAGPLVQSMRLGPTVQVMVMPRLELGFLLEPLMSGPQREELHGQIRMAALWQPEWLAAYARHRHALGMVRRALAPMPERLERFDLAWEATR